MSDTSTFVAVVLFVALPLRIALDVASITRPRPGFDIAYAVLFFVVGVVALMDDAASFWSYVAFGIAVWSLLSFFIKQKRGHKVS